MRAVQFALLVLLAQISIPWIQFIPDLSSCTGGGSERPDAGPCVPPTCESEGRECGTLANYCNAGSIDCGACASADDYCSPDGTCELAPEMTLDCVCNDGVKVEVCPGRGLCSWEVIDPICEETCALHRGKARSECTRNEQEGLCAPRYEPPFGKTRMTCECQDAPDVAVCAQGSCADADAFCALACETSGGHAVAAMCAENALSCSFTPPPPGPDYMSCVCNGGLRYDMCGQIANRLAAEGICNKMCTDQGGMLGVGLIEDSEFCGPPEWGPEANVTCDCLDGTHPSACVWEGTCSLTCPSLCKDHGGSIGYHGCDIRGTAVACSGDDALVCDCHYYDQVWNSCLPSARCRDAAAARAICDHVCGGFIDSITCTPAGAACVEPPAELTCMCSDQTRMKLCEPVDCTNDEMRNALCGPACGDRGLFTSNCEPDTGQCVPEMIPPFGTSAVVCECAGDRDVDACAAVDCASVDAFCADACAGDGGAIATGTCTPLAPVCTGGGPAPAGPNAITCHCNDQTTVPICTSSGFGWDIQDDCQPLCALKGGLQYTEWEQVQGRCGS